MGIGPLYVHMTQLTKMQEWVSNFFKVVNERTGTLGNGIEQNLTLRHDADYLSLPSCDKNSIDELSLLRAHFAPLNLLNQCTVTHTRVLYILTNYFPQTMRICTEVNQTELVIPT